MEESRLADHNESLEKFAGEMDSADKAPAQKPGDPEPPVRDDRKIIRNADLHLEVEKYEDAYKAIGEISRAKKGFIAGASTTKLANGKIRATVTLRIPPEKFEETLADLGKLGNVRHQAITTADVTKQYLDLESRLKSKETLVERLKKVLLEGRGTVKELMEVEVQMGATIEQIEAIKGELKYYNDLVGMSTITMQVSEKDMGLPFEYVQTMQATIGVTDLDADAVYANAQKAILDAGGQVAESRMTRANDDSASGYVRGKVDAEKFPALRETLKRLAKHVDQDTVNQQQTGRGGQGDAKPGAPVRKEQAVVDFTVNTPPIVSTRQAAITIEAAPAGSAYQDARKEVEAAGGKILAGSLTDKTGGATAFVRAQVDAEKFPALVEKFKSLGKVKNATVKQDEPGAESGRPPLYREKGEIVLEILTPAPLLTEEQGFGRVVRETFAKSIAGVLWSFEKLFVGIALAGPWIVLAILVILLWRRARRPKTA
jgi:glycine cleavage system regulatory protein